ncbi:MAPEG family protein [Endozoicomonadaceae bacterium StTr2]
MSTTFIALTGYIGWTITLLIILEIFRVVLVIKSGRAANSFSPDGRDTTPFGHRLTRAHANCYESFPMIGGILLLALATGHAAITDPLALYVLIARIAQSTTHLISGSAMAIQIRFAFFCIQTGICFWWFILLAQLAF